MTSEARIAAIVWGVSPISFVMLGFLSLWLGALSISTIIITGIFVFVHGFVTFRFLRLLYRSSSASNTPRVRVALIFAVIGPIAYLALRQLSPIRILRSQSSKSVFDEAWNSAGQIAYGYPTPFVRFFDIADQIHGKTLIDWGSLLMIIWVSLLCVFLLGAIIGITFRITQNRRVCQATGDEVSG